MAIYVYICIETDTRSPLMFRMKIRRQRSRQCRYNWWWDRSEDTKRWDAAERWCRAVLMDGQLKETWWYSFNQFINTTTVYTASQSAVPFFLIQLTFRAFSSEISKLEVAPNIPILIQMKSRPAENL